MAEIEIPYNGGYATINLRLPKKNITILRSKNPTPSKKLDEIIDEALSKPIGGSRLSKIVKPGKKIAIIFDDFTRPTPVSLIIPQILEELKSGGVSNKDVSFICANGMHAPDFMNEELLRKKVGDRIYEEYEVSTHDAYDYNKLKFVGVTNCLGTPLFINKKVAESDIKIAIGRIAPHGDVGYSGGAKMIMPGVAGIWSIIHNHTGSYPRRGWFRFHY
ncbi:MAG: lactate racemase domain-containing protein [Deltaproteobacteria bacterium]|nr:lactate racemase domain-containing protein [Deltaproteobacteria bacterium]